ncbi:hypothetical protein R3P38DRAFT_3592781 [Favolaschia claudopus]|uniref:Uncharacterized protein n=1 Tax=Favolaschia claudopus TaxID=2862362 RepID=A0AAW0AGQ2_9AGAR
MHVTCQTRARAFRALTLKTQKSTEYLLLSNSCQAPDYQLASNDAQCGQQVKLSSGPDVAALWRLTSKRDLRTSGVFLFPVVFRKRQLPPIPPSFALTRRRKWLPPPTPPSHSKDLCLTVDIHRRSGHDDIHRGPPQRLSWRLWFVPLNVRGGELVGVIRFLLFILPSLPSSVRLPPPTFSLQPAPPDCPLDAVRPPTPSASACLPVVPTSGASTHVPRLRFLPATRMSEHLLE